MTIKAGSFLSGAATDLKYYKEEEVETSTYKLERVFSGTKLTLRLHVKDANSQEIVELIPQGKITKFFFIRMGMNITTGSTSGNNISVNFNNLTANNDPDLITFTAYNAGQGDEIGRWETIYHSQYYNALDSKLSPTVYNKPLTLQLNNSGASYANETGYELIIEFNFYDK